MPDISRCFPSGDGVPALTLRLALRLILGGLFLYAGVLKAQQPAVFLDDIRSFHLLADPWAPMLAMTLPWLEILCGFCVIAGILYPGALAVTGASLLVFLAALISGWARGLDIRCGCFGKTETAGTYAEYILRDLAMLALTGWLFVVHLHRSRSPEATA